MRPIALLSILLLAACGASTPAAETSHSDPLAPTNLYPLGAGYAWSYDVDTGTNVNTLAITRVLSANANRFEVSSGSEPIVYEIRDGSIWRPQSETWLLHAPIEVGAEWPSSGGRTARVTSITAEAVTGEGAFHDCVEVLESGSEDGRSIRTVYCPGVGPVIVDSFMQMQLQGNTLHVIAKLRGHSLGEMSAEAPAE